MKCIDELRKAAESVGASIDMACINSALILDAPVGYVWSANGDPSISEPCSNGSQSWYAAAARELTTRVGMGLEKCDAERSAEIKYDRDEPWTAPADAPERIEWPK